MNEFKKIIFPYTKEINFENIYIVDTNALLFEMMKDNDFSYDVYFRMAVIDSYLNSTNELWDLYYQMQLTRANLISRVPTYMINHKNEFIKLIKSIKQNGYDVNNPILVDRDLYVIDGAHRMACALKFQISEVSVYTNQEFIDFIPNEYTKQWFQNNGLEECIPYAETQKKILEKRIKNV